MLIRKTQILDFLSVIKRNLASFIVLAVLLGTSVSMFCGPAWTCKTEKIIINNAASKSKTALAEYSFPYGTGICDVESITGDNPDLIAEGFYTAYRLFYFEDSRFEAKIMSLTEKMNIPDVISGKLPENEGEVAVRNDWAVKKGLKVGDKIVFEDNTSRIDGLKVGEYTVTALIESGRYSFTLEDLYGMSPVEALPINCYMYVAADAFDHDISGFSNIGVFSLSMNEEDFFSDEFKEKEKKITDSISGYADEIYRSGYNTVLEKSRMVFGDSYELDDSGYYVTLKSENGSATLFVLLENILTNIRSSLTLLFVLVSIFVGYSVVSRMVHDHMKLIGTKNANGMKKTEIFALYFGFCMFALVAGTLIIGIGISYGFVVALQSAMSSSFSFEQNIISADWLLLAGSFGILIPFVSGIVFVSVRSVMKMSVINQLAGDIPASGKKRFYEKFRLWNKLSLLTKTMINNLFNDKRRVWGTTLGIMGSTALIVASFTFSNLILNSFNQHFEKYYKFDSLVRFIPGEENQEEVKQVLDGKGYISTPAFLDNYYIKTSDGKNTIIGLYVYYDEESFSKLFTLETTEGKTITKGLYFTYALEKDLKLSPGSEIVINKLTGGETKAKIDGFFLNYLFETVAVCDIETYETLFGDVPSANSFFVDSNKNYTEVTESFSDTECYISTLDYIDISELSFEIIRLVLIAMKALFLIVAVGMAVMVLWNLISVFIDEKKRDLITLMINGYEVSFAKKYIYKDIILLALLGTVLGSVVGEIFGNLTTDAFASASCRFHMGIDGLGIVYGILIMAVITTVICLITLKKIDRLKLSDLNL